MFVIFEVLSLGKELKSRIFEVETAGYDQTFYYLYIFIFNSV